MNNQEPFDNDDSQFVVSFELLCLLQWLFENEQETMKKLINKAFSNGLFEKLHRRERKCQEELQQSVLDFFSLLETLLYELLSEDEVKKIVQRNLMPSIDKIDSILYNDSNLAASVAKATAAYENNPKQNPNDILCKELLKHWKPSKKIALN